VEDSVDVLEGAAQMLEPTGDAVTFSMAAGALGYYCLLLGEADRGRTWNQRSLVLAQSSGDPVHIVLSLALAAHYALIAGDPKGSRQCLEQARTHIDLTSGVWVSAPLLWRLGELCLREGDANQGLGYLEEGARVAERNHDLQGQRICHTALADYDLQMGQYESARKRVEPLLGQLGLAKDTAGVVRAGAVAADAVRRARGQNLRLFLVDALRVQGMTLAQQQSWDEASRVFGEAAQVARAIPYPHAEARVLYECGQLYVQQGELDLARDRLEDALAIFQRLGARLDVEQTERAIAGLSKNYT
jgi:tetratricopeptide (TPR) repeat protein